MTNKDNQGREYYIPYIIEDDETLKVLNISRSDLITYSFGNKRVSVYMVPNTDKKVYDDIMHLIWSDLSKQARESRCKIANGKGGFCICKGNCQACCKTRKGLPDSVEAETELNGFEVEDDSSDDIEKLILRMTLEDLFVKLRKLNPQYADILEGLYKEMSHHEIGLNLGKSESTIQEQAALALILAKKILSECLK